MAFGETASADAAMAIIRLTRKMEALQKELDAIKSASRLNDLRRIAENSKTPKEGPRGVQGLPGERGPKGDTGPMPDHRWNGTRLSIQKPDGRFGIAVDLQGPSGQGGSTVIGGGRSASLSNVALTDANYLFPNSDPQIEQAVNALGAKINEIIEALN